MNPMKDNPYNDFPTAEIRVIRTDGGLLFCARDTAGAFGFADPQSAVRNHCRHTQKHVHRTASGVQNMNFIELADVERLAAHSRLNSRNELLAQLIAASASEAAEDSDVCLSDLLEVSFALCSALTALLSQLKAAM